MRKIQERPREQRIVVFLTIMGFIFVLIIIMTIAITIIGFNRNQRVVAEPLVDNLMLAEYVQLEDEEAYPVSIAIGADETLYTGSYATGAIYEVNDTLDVRELPNTRDMIGSVTALTIGNDGTLYILDRIDYREPSGGKIWTMRDDVLTEYLVFDSVQVTNVNDIAIDSMGRIYFVNRLTNQIWRVLAGEREMNVWWQPDPSIEHEIIGLAYDITTNSLVVTDAISSQIYRIPVEAENPLTESETIFEFIGEANPPNFYGVTVAPDGTIYTAALGINRLARINPTTGELIYIAEGFRGASDVAYSPETNRIYVTNWDQVSLLNMGVSPRLPFAIDVLEFNDE